MLKRIVIVLIFLCPMILVSAQDLSKEYVFVDGTTLDYPNDFLDFDKAYDRVTLSNNQTEIEIIIIFERRIIAEDLAAETDVDTLKNVLEWWADPSLGYDNGDEEVIRVGDHEAIRFDALIEDSDPSYERSHILLRLENGSVIIFRVQPDITHDYYTLEQEDLVLSIIASTHYEDLRAGIDNVLGNAFVFDDGYLIEYRDSWILDEEGGVLSSGRTLLSLSAFTAQELADNQRKDDPIEVLYYEVFAPDDESIVFDPGLIEFITIRGREMLRYTFTDRVDDQALERTYLLINLDDGTVVVVDFQAVPGTVVLDNRDVQDMIQTIRLEGTLPPFALMPMENTVFVGSITMRYPDYWFPSDRESGAMSLSSLDTNIVVEPLNADEVDSNDLISTLPEVFQPIDEDVTIAPDDIELIRLDNGLQAARIQYTETDDRGNVYEQIVLLIGLPDGSALLIGISPQPGISVLTADAISEAMAIINTISSR